MELSHTIHFNVLFVTVDITGALRVSMMLFKKGRVDKKSEMSKEWFEHN